MIMKKLLRYTLLTLALYCGGAGLMSAITVEATPGNLAAAVAAAGDPATETQLTVTGAVNAADFDFIRTMRSLRTLDMSGARIDPYSGKRTEAGVTVSAANLLPDGAFISTGLTSVALPAGVTEIGDGAFSDTDLETLVIPASVRKIGKAFTGMKKLTSATIPATVSSVADGAFADCPALVKVTFGADVTELPASLFRGCGKLADVTLTSPVTTIGDYAFAGCGSLKSITLPASLTVIGDYAFASTGLEALDLSETKVGSVGDWAFAGCGSLSSITVGKGLTEVGKGAFFNNSSLIASAAKLLDGVTEFPDYLLYGASDVTLAGIEELPIERIGDYALSGNNTATLVFPGSLASLGDNAMERWSNLEKLDATHMKEIPALGSSVWEDTPQSSAVLIVPKDLYDSYADAPQWQEFDVKSETSAKIEIPASDVSTNLRASFDGMLLMLEADVDIRGVQLYDITGRCFTIKNDLASQRAIIDTAPFDARVFIVRVILADSTTPVLKLAR